MATTLVSNDGPNINAYDNHLEIFSLIWLDANDNINDSRDTQQNLRSIINQLKIFQDPQECQQYIEQKPKEDRLVLIVSGQMGRVVIPIIHRYQQVSSIYVYCNDTKNNKQWASQFPKIKAVVMEVHELVARIKADHKSLTRIKEPLSITMFNTGKSTTGVNGQFVFSQVLIDCLLRMESNQRDIDELISRCKTEYYGNNTELDKIREFQDNYSSDTALWWYTRESFYYRTLNKALRCQNIDMIFLYRSFITDIYHQLHQYKSKIPLRIYRCQLMTKDELEDLKQYIGQFISVNSFLSTSKEYSTALFLAGDTTEQTYMERVLFVIDANPDMAISQPFADISTLSEFGEEAEVLFMVGSIFRLKSISCEADQRWTIQMILCSGDEHDFKDVLAHMKKQNGSGPTNLRTFGKVLWQMGKLDLAEKYFKRLLTERSLNDPVISNVYEDLAQITSQKGDFDNSMQWRQKFLAVKNQHQPTCTAHINNISNFIGKFIEKFDRY